MLTLDFAPELIFDSLYAEKCLDGIGRFMTEQNPTDPFCFTPADWVIRIRNYFRSRFKGLANKAPLTVHRAAFHSLRKYILLAVSYTECFTCLLRTPEHLLDCGHSICDTCVVIHSAGTGTCPYEYVIKDCLLCGARVSNVINLQPPTAGYRILSLDGGGVRGIVELELLQALENEMQINLVDCFDLIVGTSSGGLIALGLGAKLWTIEHCASVFERLLSKAFKPRTLGIFPVVNLIQGLLVSWFSDSVYDSAIFAAALEDAYGSDEVLFGAGQKKVAVVATTTSSFPCLIANYNGCQERPPGRGYGFLTGKRLLIHEW